MGSAKRRTVRRKSKATAVLRFPVGELARRRNEAKEKYLSKSKELSALRKKLDRIKKKTETISGEISSSVAATPTPAFAVSHKAALQRKQSPTEISPEGNVNLPARSKYRKHLETLLAAAEIHGGSHENRKPALDGMFTTPDKYATPEHCKQFISQSKRFREASISLAEEAVCNYEKSPNNLMRSFSLLYEGGLVSKRKYEQTRSALGTFCSGTKTEKGYIQRKRIKLDGGILVPRILPYKKLMSHVNNVDIGELISVRDTLCSSLPIDERVDGAYRDLEAMLLSICEYRLMKPFGTI